MLFYSREIGSFITVDIGGLLASVGYNFCITENEGVDALKEVLRKSKPKTATWLGRKGEIVSHHLDSKNDGLRIVVIKWLDGSNEALVKLVKGDGRNLDFISYHEETVTHGDVNSRVADLVED